MAFEQFSDNARRAMLRVGAVASSDNATQVEPVHLLVALMLQDNTATAIVAACGINPRGLAKHVAPAAVTRIDLLNMNEQVPLGATVRNILKAVAEEVGTGRIGTEHLLLAFHTTQVEDISALLNENQVTEAEIRKNINRGLNDTVGLHRAMAESIEQAGDEGEDTPLFAAMVATRRARGNSGGQKNGLKLLPEHARNLTDEARKGRFDPIIGRENEVHRLMQILTQKIKNNPLLLGEPGVGKTAVVEALAMSLTGNHVPKNLQGRDLWMLDVNSLVAGTKFRGDFEERLKQILQEAVNAHVILFIDEIHNAIGAGTSESANADLANVMKPLLARGELQTIGATTEDEFRKQFQKDPAFERRFQPVQVKEPTNEQTLRILHGVRDSYESWHDVEITDEALEAAVTLSVRYITDRFLPDKALTLVDGASSRAQFQREAPTVEVLELERLIEETDRKKMEAITASDFEGAARYRDQAEKLHADLEEAVTASSGGNGSDRPVVTAEDIAHVVAEATGVPVEKVTADESRRLLGMERELNKQVIGQAAAMKALSRAVRRSRAGLKDPNRPAGSFVFAGSTGTGKTESAKALAEFLFGQQRDLLTFDMSEYAEKQSVSRLIGSPPGYVGHDEGGQLTEAVRKRPFSVVLLDEVEKAHPDVFDTLLQVLEEGRLTDGKGRVVNFRDTVLILTTNLGSRSLASQPIGFLANEGEGVYADKQKKVANELKNHFKPELLNRFDDVIVFSNLTAEAMTSIAGLMLVKFTERLASQNVTLSVTPDAVAALAKAGYSPEHGARLLRREIVARIEDPVTELYLAGGLEGVTSLNVDWNTQKGFIFNGLSVTDIDRMVDEVSAEIILDDASYAPATT